MLKRLLVNATMGTASLLLSTLTWSADSAIQTAPAAQASSEQQAAPASMTRDEWFAKLKVAAPDLICKSFLEDASIKAKLAKINIDYNKCISLIPASIDKCQADMASSMPAVIDEQASDKWGSSVGQCIGKDFAVKYLI